MVIPIGIRCGGRRPARVARYNESCDASVGRERSGSDPGEPGEVIDGYCGSDIGGAGTQGARIV